MYTDIVIPDGNEDKFVKFAEMLGYSSLCFLYEIEDFKKPMLKSSNLDIYHGVIVSEKDVKKGRKTADFVVVKKPNDLRLCVEKEKPDIVFDVECDSGKDFIHQRDSALDNVTSKIFNEKTVFLGFSLQNINSSSKKEVLLGRVMQNLVLVKKHNIGLIISSLARDPYDMRNPEDIVSLISTVGLSKNMAKLALQKVPEIFITNRKKRSGHLVDGVEIVGKE